MASSTATHRVEIPELLWRRLDQVARAAGMPTSQLVGTWLWEELNRRSRIPGDQAEGLALDDHPYRMAVRSYPRRDPSTCSHEWPDEPGAATITCRLCGMKLVRAG